MRVFHTEMNYGNITILNIETVISKKSANKCFDFFVIHLLEFEPS